MATHTNLSGKGGTVEMEGMDVEDGAEEMEFEEGENGDGRGQWQISTPARPTILGLRHLPQDRRWQRPTIGTSKQPI